MIFKFYKLSSVEYNEIINIKVCKRDNWSTEFAFIQSLALEIDKRKFIAFSILTPHFFNLFFMLRRASYVPYKQFDSTQSKFDSIF